MRRISTSSFALLFSSLLVTTASVTGALAQTPSPGPLTPGAAPGPRLISPLTEPTLTPGAILLMELEARFAQDVAKGGGKAFSSWFADDAVTLSNGKQPVLGKRAITANAVWDPKNYQLTWTPQGAQMGPSGDTGFTWGHYEGKSLDKNGQPITVSGRYITFWKKVADGTKDGAWKVALDASSDDAPAEGDCCTLPKP